MSADRYYPVVIEQTQYRVTMVAADSAADAAAKAGTADLERLWEDGEDANDYAGLTVLAADKASRIVDAMVEYDGGHYGPVEACPECGGVARYTYDWALHHAAHRPTCSGFNHYISIDVYWDRDGSDSKMLYYLDCTCDEPGFERLYGDARQVRRIVTSNGRVLVEDRSDLAAIAQAHVAGRPHSKNLPLGITEDLRHPDPRRLAAAAS